MPTLASNRAIRSPVTPRVAAHATPPLSRKTTQNSLASGAKKEGLSTPVKAFLNNNVTPRSSSRKSRVGSPAVETPTSTPSKSTAAPANDDTESRQAIEHATDGLYNKVESGSNQANSFKSGHDVTISSVLCPSTVTAEQKNAVSNTANGASSQFFHANDAKSREATSIQKKASTFFYANGQQEQRPKIKSQPASTLSLLSTKAAAGNFFHADGSVESSRLSQRSASPTRTAPPLALRTGVSRALSSVSSVTSRSQDNFHLSYRKGVSQILKPGNLKPVPSLPTSPLIGSGSRRRSATTEGKPHDRASSLSSLESTPVKETSSLDIDNLDSRLLGALASSQGEADPTLSPLGSIASPSAVLSPQMSSYFPFFSPSNPPEEVGNVRATTPADESTTRRSSANYSVPQSPSKLGAFGNQNLAQLAEVAANARRERKVLDLEISNSSLLAINKQLEKEVRKQRTELRRFRRLTRAGRLSSVSTAPVKTEENDETANSERQLDRLDELSEDESDSDDDDAESSSGSSTNSSVLSPSTLANRDAKKLEKDSKRLRIDLTKHRQLLIDSSKMNQSIKRCMAWSEEMIREGRKQLDYQIRVSDVNFGGRVLDADVDHEEDDSEANDRGLLGPWSPVTPLSIQTAEKPLGLGIATQRASWQSGDDSGVEVGSARTSGSTDRIQDDDGTAEFGGGRQLHSDTIIPR